jgi:hypothetical protein
MIRTLKSIFTALATISHALFSGDDAPRCERCARNMGDLEARYHATCSLCRTTREVRS